MCGINGIVFPADRPVIQQDLVTMRDALTHRGPEGAGFHIDHNVGFGHRRLKIIDLTEAGRQPMANEDGSVVVTFNGEIYNFKPIREQLKAKGHTFRSQADTEVLVHGYEEWREGLVEKLNGIFAFAVLDKRRREVFIARDHIGVKPLYYTASGQTFLFASEIKAFLGFPGFQPQMNSDAVPEFLLYRSLSGDATLFSNVKALPAGHWLRIDRDLKIESRRYWDISFPIKELGGGPIDDEKRVFELLEEIVALQEMSDVPIGAQLSGGTDSSLVTALMAKRSIAPIKTFSVGFDDVRYNELPFARLVAQRLNTEHHEMILREEEFAESLETLAWQQDEPVTHANAAGVFVLCRYAKTFATVLLTGEGADEGFAGYYRYELLRKILRARSVVRPFRWLAFAAPNDGRIGLVKRALSPSVDAVIAQGTANGLASFGQLMGRRVVKTVIEARQQIIAPAHYENWLTRALYYDLKTYLPPILMRQDKMSMAHAIETRVPFLDYRLLELAYRLPARSKLSGGTGKQVIKQIASRYLPREVLYRTKVGFGIPLQNWMRSRDGLGARLDWITASNSASSTLLPAGTANRMVNDHRAGIANNADALWTLLALETWHRVFFNSRNWRSEVPSAELAL